MAVASRCPERFCLAASMSRSTSRSVKYSRLRLPTVTFTEVGADFRSRAFSMEIALPPVCTVTNLAGRVTKSKSPDHRKRHGQHSSPFGLPPDFELSVADARRRAVVPKGLICPARMPTIRGSISSRRDATLLRDCNCTCPFEDHLTSPVPLNRHRLRRL
jgi:hypothetical protein